MRLVNAILLLSVISIGTPAEVHRTPLQPPPVKERLREICEREGGRIKTENPAVELTVTCDAARNCYRFLYKRVAEGEAQEIIWYPSFNIDVVITASVKRGSDKSGQLDYLYGVESATSSRRPVQSFALEYLPGTGKVWAPDEDWESFITTAESDNKVVRWHCFREPLFGIVPGGEEHGFAIDTSALPTLTRCWAVGHTQRQMVSDDEPPFEVLVFADTSFFGDSVHGLTIGPATGTKPASWERMREFLEESKKQHWITEESAQRVAELIAQAEKAEAGEDKQAYRTALQRLLDAITTLYTPEEENMTSEAYALFFFHGEARLNLLDRERE